MLPCFVQATHSAPLSYTVVRSMFVPETTITEHIYNIYFFHKLTSSTTFFLLLMKVYSKQQMGELLGKIRESSIASLAQNKDAWGHTVTS